MCVLSQSYSCLGTIQSVVNCTSEWFLRNNTRAGGRTHPTATTLLECQKACEFVPHCVAVDWLSNTDECWIVTSPNHTHPSGTYTGYEHYDLVSRCNITSGQSVF